MNMGRFSFSLEFCISVRVERIFSITTVSGLAGQVARDCLQK